MSKLKNVRNVGNNTFQAACPVCQENGSDKSGDHLRIWPSGAYGCAVYSGDSEHRKQIYAIAGGTSQSSFSPSATTKLFAANLNPKPK